MGNEDIFPRVKWPGHKADHWPPSIDKVKNEWSFTPPFDLIAYTEATLPSIHNTISVF